MTTAVNAAATYVVDAHWAAFFALGYSTWFVMFVLSNQASTILLLKINGCGQRPAERHGHIQVCHCSCWNISSVIYDKAQVCRFIYRVIMVAKKSIYRSHFCIINTIFLKHFLAVSLPDMPLTSGILQYPVKLLFSMGKPANWSPKIKLKRVRSRLSSSKKNSVIQGSFQICYPLNYMHFYSFFVIPEADQ